MAKRDRYKEYARDKAIARVAGLKKALQETRWNEASRKNIENRISVLENTIFESRTFADGKRIAGHTKESTLAAAKMLESLVRETPIQRNLRKMESFERQSDSQRNKIFTDMMNLASQRDGITVTIGKKTFTMTDSMVRMFYYAYQDLWNTGNVSVKDRNAVILQQTGFRTLEEAFAIAMGTGNNYRRSQILEKAMNQELMSDEETAELYNMLSEGQQNVSYKAGSIAANTQQLATRMEGGGSGRRYYLAMTEAERLSALRNFLGQNFEWSDLY